MAIAARGLLLSALVAAAPAQGFAANSADANANVCLVTFSSAGHAGPLDMAFVAAASVMPRPTAEKLVNDYSKIFVYRDADTLDRACACLSNPIPANTLAQRQKNLVACPKPNSVN